MRQEGTRLLEEQSRIFPAKPMLTVDRTEVRFSDNGKPGVGKPGVVKLVQSPGVDGWAVISFSRFLDWFGASDLQTTCKNFDPIPVISRIVRHFSPTALAMGSLPI